MSRTDKDRPYRVRAADPHEQGRYPRHNCGGIRRRWQRTVEELECDLPDFHDRTPRGPRYWLHTVNVCTWDLDHWVFSPYGDGPPSWYRNHVWHAPERVRERDHLREAAKAYNAGDDLEDYDFPNFQARSCAKYYYW